jgi:hypothetical protein
MYPITGGVTNQEKNEKMQKNLKKFENMNTIVETGSWERPLAC